MSICKNLFLISCFAISTVSMVLCKKQAIAPEVAHIKNAVKTGKPLSNYPEFERWCLGFEFLKGLGFTIKSSVLLKDTTKNLLDAKSKYGINNFHNDTIISIPYINQKLVLFIGSGKGIYARTPVLSVKDYERYRSNNIAIFQSDCTFNQSLAQMKKYKPFWLYSLCLNKNTIIDFYGYKTFGCDATFIFTPYPKPITIVIDEQNIITHILDTIKSDTDMFKFLKI